MHGTIDLWSNLYLVLKDNWTLGLYMMIQVYIFFDTYSKVLLGNTSTNKFGHWHDIF